MLTPNQQTYIELVKIKSALTETLETFPDLENTYTFTTYNYLLSDILQAHKNLRNQLDFIQNQINILKSDMTPEELKQMYAHLQNEKA